MPRKTKFLTPTEHGNYWRDLAQKRIVRIDELERALRDWVAIMDNIDGGVPSFVTKALRRKR